MPNAPTTAVARARANFDHIRRHNGAVNAIMTVTEDAALADAERADAAAAEGRWLGLLHGMTVAVKDNIDTAGVLTTSGAMFLADHIPNADAAVVQRLRTNGAVIVGKATMHELAFGIRTENPVAGVCRNPWALDRVPGGSSGGSGAAVATDMCVGALGTDTGGSVRLPAAMTGVVGLRPTHGRLSIRGILPVSVTHDTVGPMARRVEDVARLFAALAGHDPLDPQSREGALENFLPTLGEGIEGTRIGIPKSFYFENLNADVERGVRAAASVLESLGSVLEEITLKGADRAHAWAQTIIYSDICAVHADRFENHPEQFLASVYERMKAGSDYTGVDYARALRAREAWRETLRRVFESVDMVLMPTTPGEPPPLDDSRTLKAATDDATRYTYGGALAGVPSLSLPCGFTSAGLPIGVMLEAAWCGEPLLLRAGVAYQGVTDWHRRRPPILEAQPNT